MTMVGGGWPKLCLGAACPTEASASAGKTGLGEGKFGQKSASKRTWTCSLYLVPLFRVVGIGRIVSELKVTVMSNCL